MASTGAHEPLSPQRSLLESLPFYRFCQGLELAAVHSRAIDKLAQVFPDKLQESVETELAAGRPCSWYPLMRLLIPDADRTRHKYNIGLKNLQVMIVEKILLLPREAPAAQKVYNFTNPNVAGSLAARQRSNRGSGSTTSGAGDFAQVIENVLEPRRKGLGRTLTIGDVNAKLDALATATTGDERFVVMTDLYNNFSANEMKWTLRIILKNMMIGLKKAVVLKWYHPDAADYYDACNQLEQVLDKLVNRDKRHVQELKLFQIFTPMLAKKDKKLDVQKIFRSSSSGGGGSSGKAKKIGNDFVVEPKYDGERIILHWDANAYEGHGELALYTRNANVYTEKYGDALKPWLRNHIKADRVILDGEIMSWDSTLARFGQFGNNNGVMLEQKLWEGKHGRWNRVVAKDGIVGYQRGRSGENIVVPQTLSGEADDPAGLEKAIRSLRTTDSRNTLRAALKTYLREDFVVPPGEEIRAEHVAEGHALDGTRWMTYMCFDIVFCEGLHDPNAARESEVEEGLLAGYPLRNRRELLRRVLVDAPRRIERVRGKVIRPQDYERGGARADAMHVEVMEIFDRFMIDRSEGAMLKDLTSPYLPGNASRKKGHWLKLKPDYIDGMGEHLDMLILGMFYGNSKYAGSAKNFRAGGISHFVVGVAGAQETGEDSSDKPTRFHTVCRVGSGYTRDELFAIRAQFAPHQQIWKEGNLPPHFAKCAAFPTGWKPSKTDDVPDLWIPPEHSIVVEVRCASIAASDRMSANLVARFPRVHRLRNEDKEWYDCMTLKELNAKYQLGGAGIARLKNGRGSRRITQDQLKQTGTNKRPGGRAKAAARKKAKKNARGGGVDVSKIKQKERKDSIFAGVSFCVMTAHATSSGIEREQKCAIERVVYENRGVYTALPCLAPVKTKYIITTESRMQDHDIRVYCAAGGGEDCNYDLVTPQWVDRCITAKQLLEPEYGELLGMTSLTRRRVEVLADVFGDSYTIPLNRGSLCAIFERMLREAEEEKKVKKTEEMKKVKEGGVMLVEEEEVGDEEEVLPPLSLTRNLDELEHTALLAVKQNVLRDFVVYLDGSLPSTAFHAHNRNFLLACQLREMGAIVATKIHAHVTHIVIDPDDISRVAAIADRLRDLRGNEQFLGGGVEKRCVFVQWARDCVDRTQRIAVDAEDSYIFDLREGGAKGTEKLFRTSK